MSSLIRNNKTSRLIALLDLRGKLRYYGYDDLDLNNLDKLRSEVQNKIEELTGKREIPEAGR